MKMKETSADEAVRVKALENSGAVLLEIVESIEAILGAIGEHKETLAARYDMAKGAGYDKKALKALIKRRAMTDDQRKAQGELSLVVATYEGAVALAELAALE